MESKECEGENIWFDFFESVFFVGCKVVRKNKYFKVWVIRLV